MSHDQLLTDSVTEAAAALAELAEASANLEPILSQNSSCIHLKNLCRKMASGKLLREFVLTMPSMNIYANIGFHLKTIQHESKFVTLSNGSKRPVAMIMLSCDPQFTEVLKSMAEIQEKLGDAVLAEVKVTSAAKAGTTRLDVFCGRIDLAGQLRSNVLEDDAMASVVLRLRLTHLISGDGEIGRVNGVFNYLTGSVIAEMIRKAFDDE